MIARSILSSLLALGLAGCHGGCSGCERKATPAKRHAQQPRPRPPAPPPAPLPPGPPPLADTPKDLLPADPPATAGSLAPSLTENENTPLLSWIEGDSAKPRVHRVRTVRWEGKRWGAPMTVAEGEMVLAEPADPPHVTPGREVALIAAWAESGARAGATAVALARSTDGGMRWVGSGHAHADDSATEHGFTSLLSLDDVAAFWLDGGATATGGATALRTATIDIEGKPSHEASLDDRVCDCCTTDAAATPDGAVLVYRDRSDEEVRDIAIVRLVKGAWTKPRPVHVDGWTIPGCPVDGPAVSTYKDRVAVAWFTAAGDVPRVLVAFSEDRGASFGKPVTVNAPFERRVPLGGVNVVLVGPDAVVSWVAARRGDAGLLVRRVANDGKRGPMLQIGAFPNSRAAGAPRLLFYDPGDELMLVWTEPGPPARLRGARLPASSLGAVRADPAARPEQPAAALAPGAPAPALALHDLDGGAVSLDALRGQVVVVNLWATWCQPCRQELPELAKLAAAHRDEGLRVVGISVDRSRAPGEIAALAKRMGATYDLWHDPEDRSSAAFAVAWLPATFVIDRAGTVAWARAGAIAAGDPELAKAVVKALAAKAPSP